MTSTPLEPLALLVLGALGVALSALLGLVAWAVPAVRRGTPHLVLALALAAPGARAAGDAPLAEPFACPVEGRVGEASAPADYHAAPDARCIQGGLVELVDATGKPFPRLTRVGPGWYLTAAGYVLYDAQLRRVVEERDSCRAELAHVRASSESTTVQRQPGWSTGAKVALGVGLVLLTSYGGCRALGGCRWP